jgi:TPR repeat protein
LAEAEFNVGMCLAHGSGTAANEKEAFNCFKSAAQKGLPQAEFETGLCLRQGRGTATDFPEAFVWLTLAARRAIPDAREACEELQSEMTQEQLEDGRQRLNLLAPSQTATPLAPVEIEHEVDAKFPSE